MGKRKEVKHWEGPVTFTGKDDKHVFRVLSWLAKAASKDPTRCFMSGIFNEVIDGNRIFVATDGRHLHKVELIGSPAAFAGIPAGNLAFKADSKQITFTVEIDAAFPNYNKVIPDITDTTPISLPVFKSKELGYTEALYELYAQGIKVNALHVEAMDGFDWKAYAVRNVFVGETHTPYAVYTVVAACLRGT
jgi:hypothetical protein